MHVSYYRVDSRRVARGASASIGLSTLQRVVPTSPGRTPRTPARGAVLRFYGIFLPPRPVRSQQRALTKPALMADHVTGCTLSQKRGRAQSPASVIRPRRAARRASPESVHYCSLAIRCQQVLPRRPHTQCVSSALAPLEPLASP